MTEIDKITQLYDSFAEYENKRLSLNPQHEAEFELTKDVLFRYVKPNSFVLDIGSGTGIYSKILINELDAKVALIDLSAEELRIFNRNLHGKEKENVLFCKKSSATELEWIEDEKFDHVLLLGPLYHLIEKYERKNVLKSVHRILKPQGKVICAYLSPYHKYATILRENARNLKSDGFINNLKKGTTYHGYENVIAEQYRCWPSEAMKELLENNFTIKYKRNLEGIGSIINEDELTLLKEDSDLKEKWFNLLRDTCEIEDILGSTLHFIVVGEK
jgi:ubiquinone/menaquinone biosynthesis C-methylase UbiE